MPLSRRRGPVTRSWPTRKCIEEQAVDVKIAREMAIEVATAAHAGRATGSERTRPETIVAFFAAIVAGDAPTLLEILTPDAVTRWPQTGEQITSATSCLRVYEAYPGGPPTAHVQRVSGAGDTWVA